MIETKKAQSAIEFIILIGAILFFLGAFLFYLYDRLAEQKEEAVLFFLDDTALMVQSEINLAARSSSGYSRNFTLPGDILGRAYSIEIVESWVYAKTLDEKNALAYPVLNVFGNVFNGTNSIRNFKGEVYLNS